MNRTFALFGVILVAVLAIVLSRGDEPTADGRRIAIVAPTDATQRDDIRSSLLRALESEVNERDLDGLIEITAPDERSYIDVRPVDRSLAADPVEAVTADVVEEFEVSRLGALRAERSEVVRTIELTAGRLEAAQEQVDAALRSEAAETGRVYADRTIDADARRAIDEDIADRHEEFRAAAEQRDRLLDTALELDVDLAVLDARIDTMQPALARFTSVQPEGVRLRQTLIFSVVGLLLVAALTVAFTPATVDV